MEGSQTNTTNIAISMTALDAVNVFVEVTTLAIDPILILWAFVSSTINCATFIRMGVQNSINQNFFILSVSDFFVAFSMTLGSIFDLMEKAGYTPSLVISVGDFMAVRAMGTNFPLVASIIITTVIAIIRCCFVTFPLRAPILFTTGRQLICILVPCGAAMTLYVYIFSHSNFVESTNPLTNITSLRLVRFGVNHPNLVTLFDTGRNVVFFTCITIMFISVIILIASLKKSARFRSSASATSSESSVAAKREAQVVKCVIVVISVFFACNLISVLPYDILMVPNDPKFLAVSLAMRDCIGLLAAINVGANFIIYYNFNSQFRAQVKSFIGKEATAKKAKTGSKTSKEV